MSKTFKILLGVILSISVIGVGAWLYITSTPEYALHKTHEDIEERGLEALKDHVTDTLKKEIEVVEGISGNAFVKMIVGAAVSDDVAEAVVSEFKQIADDTSVIAVVLHLLIDHGNISSLSSFNLNTV